MTVNERSALLNKLIAVPSPSGSEFTMKSFLLRYIEQVQSKWKSKPQIFGGEEFQDTLILVFGKPEVAVFAHMDTTGFTVRYQDQLVPIGGPEVDGNEVLVGKDSLGNIECSLYLDSENRPGYKFGRAIATGTTLTYKATLREDKRFFIGPYLDNRVGIFNLLQLAEHITHGALVFSCWEEHGGGSVPFLVKFLYEKYHISKMLVSDVTWTSDGIAHEKGVVISMRDANIPRQKFVNQIINLAQKNNIDFQLEVEGYGSSDGREIQFSPYPIDWCFVGPPVDRAHSTKEKLAKKDLISMVDLYKVLMREL